MEPQELLVLRALRLKGRAQEDGLASATGLPVESVSAVAERLEAEGLIGEMRGFLIVLPPGRERLTEALEAERSEVDQEALREVYEQFTEVNGDFKQLASDWQLRNGEPNDHTDPAYDATILERLQEIHRRSQPIVQRARDLAPRLGHYPQRFEQALQRVNAGEHNWLLGPLIDSYHTVWFELHEDLIGLSGLSREAEAASGRAE